VTFLPLEAGKRCRDATVARRVPRRVEFEQLLKLFAQSHADVTFLRRQSRGRDLPTVHFWWQVPWILHFEPSLDALSLRSDIISPIKVFSLLQVNVVGTQRLLDACRAHPLLKLFLFCSTDEVLAHTKFQLKGFRKLTLRQNRQLKIIKQIVRQ